MGGEGGVLQAHTQRGLQAHTQGGLQANTWAGLSPRGVSRPTPGGCIPACTEADPPMATAAGGRHPTGMHSCSYFQNLVVLCLP